MIQHGLAALVAILSAEPDAIHVVERRGLRVRDALLVVSYATRGAGPAGILNESPELDELQFADGTRFAEPLLIAIRSAVVRWCGVPVVTTWPSSHLEVACFLIRCATVPVATRYGLQACEIPQAACDVVLSLSVTRFLAMNVAPEQFWLRLPSDSSLRCVRRWRIRPVWPSRACAGGRHSPWHTMCDRRVPPAHGAFAPVWVQCGARSSRFFPSGLDRAGYRRVHRCKPRDLSSQSCFGARCFRLRRCCE